MKNKKAQEEVFGFVIIVMIVIIIGVVFFAFALRRPTENIEPKSSQLDDLLQATLSYTTNCTINDKSDIRYLIRTCQTNPLKDCETTDNVCTFLKNELDEILKEFLGQNLANNYVHGYSLNISGPGKPIEIEKGNQTGNYFGSSIPLPTAQGEDILVKLRFYYSK